MKNSTRRVIAEIQVKKINYQYHNKFKELKIITLIDKILRFTKNNLTFSFLFNFIENVRELIRFQKAVRLKMKLYRALLPALVTGSPNREYNYRGQIAICHRLKKTLSLSFYGQPAIYPLWYLSRRSGFR